MKTIRALTFVGLLAGAAAAVAAPAPKAPRFYYDLGPDSVDVTSYPKKQQEEYGVFARTCSQCHTLARPINSPYATREDWKRYVTRMHGKTKSSAGTEFSKADAEAVIDFLAYDGKTRKLDKKADFAANSAKLKEDFEKGKVARAKKQQEEDQSKVKEAPMPGIGVTPRP